MSEENGRRLDEEQLMNESSNTEFCEMDDDGINNIFDWLSIEDLCRLKVTCKRLYLLANEHYQRTYGQVSARYYMNYRENAMENYENNKFHKSFASVAQKVSFIDVKKLSQIGNPLNRNVKYLQIWSTDRLYIDSNAKHLKNQLKNVQTIDVMSISDRLLQLFTNLEYIVCNSYGPSIGELGNYPMLEQFDWMLRCDEIPDIIKMERFFKRHPNIKVFSSNRAINSTNWLLTSGIKFDDLVLEIEISTKDINKILQNVHSLHELNQIKRLHLKILYWEHLLLLITLNFLPLNFLKSIKVNVLEHGDKIIKALASLPNLKFLIFHQEHASNINIKLNFKHLVHKLDQLEEFHIDSLNWIDELIPFVRFSAKLRCIYINNLLRNVKFTLQMLNKKRRKLENACKLTIYVGEKQYLEIKNNSLTNSYGLVEIKRTDSYPMSKHPLRPQYQS